MNFKIENHKDIHAGDIDGRNYGCGRCSGIGGGNNAGWGDDLVYGSGSGSGNNTGYGFGDSDGFGNGTGVGSGDGDEP